MTSCASLHYMMTRLKTDISLHLNEEGNISYKK